MRDLDEHFPEAVLARLFGFIVNVGILPLRVDISGTQTQFKRHNQITPCHQNTSAPIYFFIALSSQSKESLYITITSELVKNSLLKSIWVTHSSGKYQTQFMPYIPSCLKCVIMGYYDSSSTSIR